MIFTQNIAVFALLNNWWEAKRGTMVGIVNGAGGVGQLVFLPLITWLLLVTDFKQAILIMTGILFVVGVLPQFIFVRNAPEPMGLHKDGGSTDVVKEKAPKKYYFSPVDWTVKDAVRSASLWCIVLSWGASTWAFLTLTVFGFTHLTNKGFSSTLVATAMGAMGITTIIGSLLAGLVVDRFRGSGSCRWSVQQARSCLAGLPIKQVPTIWRLSLHWSLSQSALCWLGRQSLRQFQRIIPKQGNRNNH